MKINLLFFGIAREIAKEGGREFHLAEDVKTVRDLLIILRETYPELERLKSLALAVNSEYVAHDHSLQDGDEVALIPPVSGG